MTEPVPGLGKAPRDPNGGLQGTSPVVCDGTRLAWAGRMTAGRSRRRAIGMRDRANIFIVCSRFQFLIAGHMARSMPEFAEEDNYLVLDMRADGVRLGADPWREVLSLDPPVGDRVLGSGARCRRAVARVEKILSRYVNAELFLPDVRRPLSGALAGLVRRPKGRRVDVCLFPDDVVGLLPSVPDRGRSLKEAARSLLGLLAGVPYAVRGGALRPGPPDRIYSLVPQSAGCGAGNVVEIPRIKPLLANRNAHGCIFLGQNHEAFMPPGAFGELCEGAAQFTVDLGYRDLQYKPHPASVSSAGERVFAAFGFEILRDSRPIEEIFFTRQAACVVSFDDPALAHLKLMFGDEVRCVSCFVSETARHPRPGRIAGRSVQDLFALCGVELYA